MKVRALYIFTLAVLISTAYGQTLKSIVYDFDGFDLGATSLPEGDYSYGDLTYEVAIPPGIQGQVLGDRCLKTKIIWNNGYAAFGRGISRYLELSAAQDRLNFFFLNDPGNAQNAQLEVAIADDDNASGSYEAGADDKWTHTMTIAPGSAWQHFSIPLGSFSDNTSGGNGVFDAGFGSGKGMLLLVEFRFNKPSGNPAPCTFFLDMITFTEGAFPQGSGPLTAPSSKPGDHCFLGAHQYEVPGQYYLIPQHFEAQFPALPNRKLRYVNTYLPWASSGTTANMLPGQGYQQLLNNGYVPIITWEPMLNSLSPSDPGQPNLSKITSGIYDQYIDDFGDKLKAYNDTLIVRLMHEFDGNWYPWCIANNQQDPQLFINAWKHIVDRVRQRGANKIKWMWCPNNDFTPQENWNWVVNAYPGNNYVDIVATDVYNAHYPSALPWWRSFRWQTAEIYYYLTRYFPTKPFFICELASRERTASELSSSQTKASWFAAMDKDLQSYFRKTRAIIFFSENKSQTWALNSSTASLNSVRDNIWADDYYFMPLTPVNVPATFQNAVNIYPNPAKDVIRITGLQGSESLDISDLAGRSLIKGKAGDEMNLSELPPGYYLLTLYDKGCGVQRRIFIKE